jgi:hypothetical protein
VIHPKTNGPGRCPLVAVVLLISLYSTVWAVAGPPEPPQPGPLPALWISLGNDSLGVRQLTSDKETDDFRTSQTNVGLVLWQRLAMVMDYSMLTDRAAASRADEITFTAGGVNQRAEDDGLRWFAAGVGLRYTGDVGGQRIQDDFHHYIHGTGYFLHYDEPIWEGLAYVVLDRSWRLERAFGFDAQLSTQGGTRRFEMDATARAVLRERIFGGDCRQWFGPSWRVREGNGLASTSEAVARFEDGEWLDYGLAYRKLSLSGDWNPFEQKSSGALGIVLVTDW